MWQCPLSRARAHGTGWHARVTGGDAVTPRPVTAESNRKGQLGHRTKRQRETIGPKMQDEWTEEMREVCELWGKFTASFTRTEMVPRSSVFLNLALLLPFTQYLNYYFTPF